MDELSMIAAQAAGAEFCSKVEKFPDGLFNKAYLFTLSNGGEVVGKVPNPNAGRAHFTTASEVATMDFVRSKLNTPTPRVYTWSSNAHNPVGAEYIILEKVAGVQLEDVWVTLDMTQRLVIIKALAEYQMSWMSASFRRFGALYYADDLHGCKSLDCTYTNDNGEQVNDDRYAIGPCTGRDFFDDGRGGISFDRGPWTSVEAYRSAIGHREIACIQKLPQLPKSPISLHGPGVYTASRMKKIAAVEYYLALVDFLLPTDGSIRRPHVWHPDLHRENIYVDPTKPTQIVAIIDWQSASLLPLFDHAREPYVLNYDGPEVNGLERPKLAEDYDSLLPDAKRRAMKLYHSQVLLALYRKWIEGTNQVLWRAMEFRDTPAFDMLSLAERLLVEGEPLYMAKLIGFQNDWANLPSVCAKGNPPFPFAFAPSELAAIDNDAAAASRGYELMNQVRQGVGDLFPDKSLVRLDQYDASKKALKEAKIKLYEQLQLDDQGKAEWDANWPFDESPVSHCGP
ncbi:MAG: hypothetical protein Q9207_004847 [Kuettlingeria erythrocarpa]